MLSLLLCSTSECAAAFYEDRIGSRGPLLLTGPNTSSGATVEHGDVANVVAPRKRRRLKSVDRTKVIGWCTFKRCYQGSTSWANHVEHFKSVHFKASGGRSLCSLCLAQVTDYEGHMLAHKCQAVQCSRCTASVVDHGALKDHWLEFHCCSPPANAATHKALSSTVGWCEVSGCHQDFSSWQHYRGHYMKCHGDLDPNVCSVCLASHSESSHGDLDRKCGRCSARFSTENLLRNHLTRFHRVDVVVGWCSFLHCGQPFKSWKDRVEHERTRHCSVEERDALCHLCLELHPAGLQDHLQVHALWDVPCPLCSGRFLDDGHVGQHQEDFHHVTSGGEVPPVLGRCSTRECPASFSSWEDHVQHQVIHHLKKDPDRVCHHCLVAFPSAEQAKTHVSRHSEAHDFFCNLCPARLKSDKARVKHLRRFHAQD